MMLMIRDKRDEEDRDHRKVENVTDVIGGTVVFRTFDSLLVTKAQESTLITHSQQHSPSP
jgi:hypothetical protein